MKLISMTDFVLNEYNERMDTPYNDGALVESDAYKWVRYAKFLKQPLKLEMFVPCDEDGNILEEPHSTNWQNFTEDGRYRNIPYQEAKEKVLFEGFHIEQNDEGGDDILCNYTIENKPMNFDCWSWLDRSETIESLITAKKYPFQLTPTAIKQIQP